MSKNEFAPVGEAGADYNSKLTRPVIIAALTAASGGLLFGFDTGVTGGVTTMASFQAKFFPDVYYRTTHPEATSPYCAYDDQVLQTFTSTMYLTGMVGAMIAAVVAHRMGRKPVMMVGALAFLLGGALMAGAVNLGMLFAGRAFVGLGIGFCNNAVPVFLSEVAPAKHRGAMNSLFQLAVTIGIVIAAIINFGIRDMEKGWRLTLAIAEIPALILFAGQFFLPETPNSLLERGKREEARAVLERLRGTNEVEEEFEDLSDAAEEASKLTLAQSYKLLFSRAHMPALLVSVVLQFFQQFTGVNVSFFFAANVFNAIGKGREASLRNQVIINAVNCAATFVAVGAIDRVGRRFLLLQGGVQMFITHVVLAALFGAKFADEPGVVVSDSVAVALLVMFCIFVAGFAWSWGPLCWGIPPEVNGLETRPAAQSLVVVVNFLFSFVIGQSFLTMLCAMTWGVFLFFAGWVVIMTICVYIFLPETRGVPVERVQVLFARHPVWSRALGPHAQEILDRDVQQTTKHQLAAVERARRNGAVVNGDAAAAETDARADDASKTDSTSDE